MDIKVIYEKVLESCINGYFHEDLKILYLNPHRSQVDWSRFPAWAIPNIQTEGCHEG